MAQYFTVHPTHPQPRLIRLAAGILRDGGVIAYPTDSSYALGCRIGDAEAVRRIRQIRGIGEDHYLTLVLRDLRDIGQFAKLDNWQFRIIRLGTPGSFTFLVPATRKVPKRLQHPKRSTIGVRVPAHAVTQALLEELGEPILSSTLILPGETQPLNDAAAIRDALERDVDLVIDADPCPAEPTTVVDLATQPAQVIRRGGGDPRRLGLDEPAQPRPGHERT